jgi:hypothetical protein
MIRVLAVVLAFCLPGAALAQAPDQEPVRVMILGVYHMDNPGRDMNNVRVDPMTTPEKQAELAALADALAGFRPTAVAIESVAPEQLTLIDPRWPDYDPGDLLATSNERVQIGYRLAARAGIDRVYAIDEKDREGQPSYFPIGPVIAWAQANGRMGDLEAAQALIQSHIVDLETRQREQSVGQLLAEINASDHPIGPGGHSFYYGMMSMGSGHAQPGADLNARWYARNAQIFARLIRVTRPGDRIVVVYGAGHAYWLRHFVETTPGFVLVEPAEYLTGL